MRRLARVFKWLIFAVVILPVMDKALMGQMLVPQGHYTDKHESIRFVTMDDYIREQLARDWDAHAADWPQLERAYCLGWQYDFFADGLSYRVTQITEPDSVKASVSGIVFSCEGKFPGHMAELHIHPATSCLTQYGPCFKGGIYAYQCLPSDQDRRWLDNRDDQPFSMIQCSREATVFFLPQKPDSPARFLSSAIGPSPSLTGTLSTLTATAFGANCVLGGIWVALRTLGSSGLSKKREATELAQ